MTIADLFRRHDGLVSPNGAGNGAYPPRLLVRSQPPPDVSPVPSYETLLRERDRIAKAEALAARRLNELRDQLDAVQNELLAGARSADEKKRIRNVVAGIAQFLPRFAGAGECTDEFIPGIVKAYVYPSPQQSGPSGPSPGDLRMRTGPPQPPIREVEAAVTDPVKLGEDIVRAGRAAAREQGPRFVSGPPQPKQGAVDDQRLAEQIVRAGKRVRDGD
jgi:hypothetical protein